MTTTNTSRRSFLQTSAATAAAGTVLTAALNPPAVHAAGSDILKVGLIGCGGRGNGAAVNAMRADKGNRLTVLADVFEDQLGRAKATLKAQIGEQYEVADDKCFSGFDAYKQVMATDVDVVCLCTTPHFRPMHLKAAIDAGKHVFCEKPVAVDAPGIRSVLETTAVAKEKKLNLVSGLCWRYDLGVRATIDEIKNGAVGNIVAMQANYLTGTLWHRGRKPEWSEMEYQLRNWLYFTWLSGDHNNEQHIHTLDKMLWLQNDEPPVACTAMGGRQTRIGEEWGNIYDHFATCYEWANGVRGYSYCRQQANCFNNTECYVLGSKGQAKMLAHAIEGEKKWNYKGDKPSMYDVEHVELFKAIREGRTINNGTYMSYSTMMAIMGRMSAYTGQRVTWEQAMKSTEDLSPKSYEWGPIPVPAVSQPGQAKLV